MTPRRPRHIFILIPLVAILLFSALPAGARSPAESAAGVTWTDNFNKATLKSPWKWVREDPTHWSLTDTPGHMLIQLHQGGLLGPGGNNENLLLQKAPTGRYKIETRLVFTPTENFQFAGLLMYKDDDNFMAFGRAYASCPAPACVNDGVYFDHEEGAVFVGSNFGTFLGGVNPVSFRVVRKGTSYKGYIDWGSGWQFIGEHIAGFTPRKVGVFAGTSYQDVSEILADFDWFKLTTYP